MKSSTKISLLALLTAALSISPLTAADATSEQGASFEGKVSSYDKSSQTIKVDGETYQLLPTSRVTKSDATASAGQLATGQRVEGRYKESAEGKREVLEVDITRDADKAIGGSGDRATSESGATFRGKIGKIDRNAQTIRVDGKTYHILPTTTITRVNGASTTLSNIKQDQHVTGTFKESSEGRREVLTLEVGRRGNN